MACGGPECGGGSGKVLGTRRGSPEAYGGGAAVQRARRAAVAVDAAEGATNSSKAQKCAQSPKKSDKNMGNDDIHARNLVAY